MGKGKLAKFADMASYPHVVEVPFPEEGTDFHLRGKWGTDFFKNNHPIVLELGCGRGEYTIGLGRLFPDKNFIGIDIKGARMWTGATESLKTNMTNVGFLRTHIEFIDHFFAPTEVSELWLTFSDPQMKKATKRLTSTFFLERFRRFLADNGTIHVKTDSNFLFTYTKLLVEKNNLPIDFSTDDLYRTLSHTENPEMQRILGIQTYYEQQWISRGITIKYIKFHLPQEGTLEEPDVEIPLDEYRSYNRNKRSSLIVSK